MKKCYFCGAENPDSSVYCELCGTRLSSEDENAIDKPADISENNPKREEGDESKSGKSQDVPFWKEPSETKTDYKNVPSPSDGSPSDTVSTDSYSHKKIAIGLLSLVIVLLIIAFFTGKSSSRDSDYDTVASNSSADSSYQTFAQTNPPQQQASTSSTAQQIPASAPTPVPTAAPTSPPVHYAGTTFSPYGYAYWNYRQNGTTYRDGEILQLISDTYYSRKDEQGEYKTGYSSGRNKQNEYGYDFGFYYADNLLYYAEVRTGSPAEILVKLYYWDGVLIGCNDFRGSDSSLYTRGSYTCDLIASEFSYVYSLGAK